MTLQDKMLAWFKGNEAAVNFATQMWEAMQDWDDLEDEGKTDHNRLLAWMMIDKEYHPFFAPNAHILRPAMLQVYLKWSASNVLDRGSRLDVAKSYMLRAGYYDVLHLIAYIVGGHDWAVSVGPEIYREYIETPDEIWSEFNA